jgi:hypothetical protein
MYKPTPEVLIAMSEIANLEFEQKYGSKLPYNIYLKDEPYSAPGTFELVLEDGTDGYIIYRKSFPFTTNPILLEHYKDVFLQRLKSPLIRNLIATLSGVFEDTEPEITDTEWEKLKEMVDPTIGYCVECMTPLHRVDQMLPDHPTLYQCPNCAHPNGPYRNSDI